MVAHDHAAKNLRAKGLVTRWRPTLDLDIDHPIERERVIGRDRDRHRRR